MEQLDKKDQGILYELDLNARLTNKELAKKMELSEQSIAYRLNRLQQKEIIKSYNLLVDVSKLGLIHYKLFLRLQNISSLKENEFVDFVKKRKDVFWFVSVRGNFDYVISYSGKDIFDFQEFYNSLKNKFGQYVYSEDLVIVTKAPIFNRSYFIKNGEKKELIYGGKKGKIELDVLDKNILSALSNNARLNYIELGKQLKQNPDTIRYRFNKLKEDKVIIGARLGINPEKINRQYLLITFNLQNFNEDLLRKLELYAQNFDSIVYYINCIGSHNMEIEAEVSGEEDADRIIKHFRDKFTEYIKTYTVLTVKKEHKLNFVPI